MKKRRSRAASNTVAVIILMIIAIASGALVWYYLQNAGKGSDIITASSERLGNVLVDNGNKQVATVSLSLKSKSSHNFKIEQVTALITYTDGSTAQVTFTNTSTGWSISSGSTTTDDMTLQGPSVIGSGSQVSLTLTIGHDVQNTGNEVKSVAFNIVLTDETGKKYSVSVPEVDILS